MTTSPVHGLRPLADLLNERPFACQVVFIDVGDVKNRLVGKELQSLERLELVGIGRLVVRGPERRRRDASRTLRAPRGVLWPRDRRCGPSGAALSFADSAICKSASISSVSIVSMSRMGSTPPSTWITSPLKQRTTCTIASTLRMWLRNLLPSPCPSLAPRTSPAISTSSQDGGNDFLRRDVLLDASESIVGNGNDADVRFDRAEGIVLARDARCGEGVEQRALSDVRQPDDSGFHECARADTR